MLAVSTPPRHPPAMSHFPFAIVGFDLDGTLLDTLGDLGAAVNHALAQIGRASVPPEQVKDLVGGGPRVMLERALVRDGMIPSHEFGPLYEELLTFYRANIAVHSRAFAGAEAMLEDLAARGVKLAVVTNKLESLAVQVLDELGLTHHFTAILGGDSLGPGRAKPAPDLILEMIARLGGGRAAYVGDTTYDVLAARAARVPSLAVSFGFNDRPARDLGADAVIDRFADLVPALLLL
jgi:phosphoglycolate phosphatase